MSSLHGRTQLLGLRKLPSVGSVQIARTSWSLTYSSQREDTSLFPTFSTLPLVVRPGMSSGPAGSILDRLLARAISQPLGIMVYLSHDRPGAPRLDIVSGSSTVKPEQDLPKWERIGFGPGTLYSPDAQFARAVLEDKGLTDRLKKLRGQYIGVDGELVSFIWSGQETDFSAMIREHDDYYDMINSIMDVLADLAEHIPTGR